MTKRETKHEDRRKAAVRVICLAVAVVMLGSIIASAVLSQVW